MTAAKLLKVSRDHAHAVYNIALENLQRQRQEHARKISRDTKKGEK